MSHVPLIIADSEVNWPKLIPIALIVAFWVLGPLVGSLKKKPVDKAFTPPPLPLPPPLPSAARIQIPTATAARRQPRRPRRESRVPIVPLPVRDVPPVAPIDPIPPIPDLAAIASSHSSPPSDFRLKGVGQLTSDAIRRRFVLLEVLKPPLALRQERQV